MRAALYAVWGSALVGQICAAHAGSVSLTIGLVSLSSLVCGVLVATAGR